jgi:hypothetical protein
MNAGSSHLQEVARSLDFFTDPNSYKPFSLEPNTLRRVLACIDPRDEHQVDPLPVAVQTSGGAIGEGVDSAVALTAVNGEPRTIQEGIDADLSVRHGLKLAAHQSCKFVGYLAVVLNEMASPSDFTLDTLGRYVSFYQFEDVVTPSALSSIQDGVRVVAEQDLDEHALVSHVDGLYPEHNVSTMVGDNHASIYVVNHHPHAGLDRTLKHREEGLSVQGYHDSLAATIADLELSRLDPEIRVARLIAQLLRATAVRTVIGSGHDDMIYLEVQMTEHGPQINEVDS